MEFDNESNYSEQSILNEKKPNNRRIIQTDNFKFSSNFECGNIAECISYKHPQQEQSYVIEFKGNSDVGDNYRDKCWFYFSVSGLTQISFKNIYFILKNGNSFRKFIKQKKYRPYIVVKEQNEWKPIYISKFNNIQNQVMQVQFIYTPQDNVNQIYIAANYPYSMDDLQFHQEKLSIINQKYKHIYFHKQIIAYSVQQYPIYLYTITNQSNVLDNSQKQPNFGIPQIHQRPWILKNRLQIVITARVHPSQVSSSFFLQGLLQSLIKDQIHILQQFFIFRIVPMVNPDGVQNGNYRRDNFQQNLNRYYGHSSPQKTPSIFAIEALLSHLRQKQKLFMFMDIHGHNSAKPSFIFGNHHPKFFHCVENKTLCKLMQNLSEGYFGYNECQFSKKNMLIKQKYDEHSKQASARVFAYKGVSDNIIQSTGGMRQNQKKVLVQHSYTVQICPYILKKNILKKNKMQNSTSLKNISINPISNLNTKKQTNQPFIPITTPQVMQVYKKLGKNILISVMQMIGINQQFTFPEGQGAISCRKVIYRQLLKSGGQYCTKDNTRVNKKNISIQMLKLYSQRFQQFLPMNKIKQSKYDNYILIQILRQIQKQQLNKKVYIPFSKFVDNKILIQNQQKSQQQQVEIVQQQQQKINIISFPKRQIDFQIEKKMVMHTPKKIIRFSTQTNSNFKQLQNRIRKIIIRHKTENEKIITTKIDSQTRRPKLKFNKNLYLNNTQSSQANGPIFDDKEFYNKQEKKPNPNIQKLIKRISINKNKQYQTINHQETKNLKTPKQKVRAGGSQTRNYNQSQKQDCICISTKVLLPPLKKQQQYLNRIQKQNIRSKMPGCNKSVNIKLKKSTIQDKIRRQQINKIADSFKIIAGGSTNRMDFILKARKMLTQKADQKKDDISKANISPMNKNRILTKNK